MTYVLLHDIVNSCNIQIQEVSYDKFTVKFFRGGHEIPTPRGFRAYIGDELAIWYTSRKYTFCKSDNYRLLFNDRLVLENRPPRGMITLILRLIPKKKKYAREGDVFWDTSGLTRI